MPIADTIRERGERRDRPFDDRRIRHVGVSRHRTDHDRVAFFANAGQFRNAAEIDERSRLRESELHCRDEALATGERFAARARKCLRGVRERLRLLIFECVHD